MATKNVALLLYYLYSVCNSACTGADSSKGKWMLPWPKPLCDFHTDGRCEDCVASVSWTSRPHYHVVPHVELGRPESDYMPASIP